jgi:hypothetical protein
VYLHVPAPILCACLGMCITYRASCEHVRELLVVLLSAFSLTARPHTHMTSVDTRSNTCAGICIHITNHEWMFLVLCVFYLVESRTQTSSRRKPHRSSSPFHQTMALRGGNEASYVCQHDVCMLMHLSVWCLCELKPWGSKRVPVILVTCSMVCFPNEASRGSSLSPSMPTELMTHSRSASS